MEDKDTSTQQGGGQQGGSNGGNSGGQQGGGGRDTGREPAVQRPIETRELNPDTSIEKKGK